LVIIQIAIVSKDFLMEGYKKWCIYDRVHHQTFKIPRDLNDTQ